MPIKLLKDNGGKETSVIKSPENHKQERQEGEKEPVGLILCAETNKEQVELLEMHKDGIMVAEYWT